MKLCCRMLFNGIEFLPGVLSLYFWSPCDCVGEPNFVDLIWEAYRINMDYKGSELPSSANCLILGLRQ